MARMIFCNIAYMVFYRGQSETDAAVGGGSNPEKEEEHNFDPLGDHMYGYVPAVARTIDVARIGPVNGDVPCVRKSDRDVVPCCDARAGGVDVVWTATSPERDRVVVGWYRNATVFPILEIHHVDRLADGGPDVPANAVALCPNCHREAHYGDRADAIRQELLDQVASRRN